MSDRTKGYGFAMRKGMVYFTVLAVLLLFSGICARADEAVSAGQSGGDQVTAGTQQDAAVRDGETRMEYSSPEELAGKKIGVVTGTIYESIAPVYIPDADLVFYNSSTDLVKALKTRKIDAFVEDEPIMKLIINGDPTMASFPFGGVSIDTAFAFDRDRADPVLYEELNAHIRRLREEGTLDQWQEIWMGTDASRKTATDYEDLPAVNGTVHVLVDTLSGPFVYYIDNKIAGYEMDILTDFCREKGYALEVTAMDFDALLPALAIGRGDLASAAFSVTPERQEVVLFSEATYTSSAGAVVRTGLKGEKLPFWKELVESFEKTFIREKRYQLFLKGIRNTLLISVLSVLFGTVLGFLVYLWYRRGNRVVNAVTRFAVRLVDGLPIIVLMMVLYYIVFAHVAIEGILVAVIGFTITFGASVYGMLQTSVNAVERGQEEASRALGFNDRQTFFGIILPQAIPFAAPSYKGGIASLIRGTSVVGYIAIEDLTKIGDIVRSRTYEAFFPLLAVAVIYFVLAGALNLLAVRLLRLTDPKRRMKKGLLKEVNMHD